MQRLFLYYIRWIVSFVTGILLSFALFFDFKETLREYVERDLIKGALYILKVFVFIYNAPNKEYGDVVSALIARLNKLERSIAKQAFSNPSSKNISEKEVIGTLIEFQNIETNQIRAATLSIIDSVKLPGLIFSTVIFLIAFSPFIIGGTLTYEHIWGDKIYHGTIINCVNGNHEKAIGCKVIWNGETKTTNSEGAFYFYLPKKSIQETIKVSNDTMECECIILPQRNTSDIFFCESKEGHETCTNFRYTKN